jgi:hypothetical protein
LNKVVNSAEYGSQAKLFRIYGLWSDDYKQATKYFDEVSGEENTKKSYRTIKPIWILSWEFSKKRSI